MLFSSFYNLRLSRISKNNARADWFSPYLFSVSSRFSYPFDRVDPTSPWCYHSPYHFEDPHIRGPRHSQRTCTASKLYASFSSMALPLESDKNTYAMLCCSTFFPTIHLRIMVPVPLRYPIHVIFSLLFFTSKNSKVPSAASRNCASVLGPLTASTQSRWGPVPLPNIPRDLTCPTIFQTWIQQTLITLRHLFQLSHWNASP